MSLQRKLQNWVEAGLITGEQKLRIEDHERGASAGRWKSGVGMAGFLSILLGIALVVAANWQGIPDTLKLGVHFTLNAVLAALVWRWYDKPAYARHCEVALFALWGLTLTLIALIGQVFQLGGEAYMALRVWFWLTTPMILLFAKGAYIARLWAVAFVLYVPYDLIASTWDATANWNIRKAVLLGTGIFVPLAGWALASWPRFAAARPVMAATLRRLSVFLVLAAASLSSLEFYDGMDYGYALAIPAAFAVFTITTRFIVQSGPRWLDEERTDIDIICIAGLLLCAPFLAPVQSGFLAMLHFIALWLLAGLLWQQGGRGRLVSLAIAMVTLRLFIGFVELFGSMMLSGFGFIVTGVVLLALMRGARALDKRLKGPQP